MKLWKKNTDPHEEIHRFTVGRDREFDMQLAAFDVTGSIAHARMLGATGIISKEESIALETGLIKILDDIQSGIFQIDPTMEDIHSQVEYLLTASLGETGKKIHTARSRNDQVLLDLRLYTRQRIMDIANEAQELFDMLQQQSERYRNHLLPGYTHLQIAMPSSFGLWFGAYAESLVDDLIVLRSAYETVNKNPLGSAAGYGSSFPINRAMTTELLGFEELNYNVVYAQMGRGKTERIVAMALVNIADTLAKLAMDACLFMNQNFGFISFPDELTTGSSIMPHKKNPDVFELIRAKCNRIKSLPNEIMMITTNLPSGYHRDLQILKEHLFPAFGTIGDCIKMTMLMLSNINIRENILEEDKYRYLFTVEEVNRLVMEGMSFRDAYHRVGLQVESGSFKAPDPAIALNHSHEGSIGNLCNEEIRKMMAGVMQSFNFEKVEKALVSLKAGS